MAQRLAKGIAAVILENASAATVLFPSSNDFISYKNNDKDMWHRPVHAIPHLEATMLPKNASNFTSNYTLFNKEEALRAKFGGSTDEGLLAVLTIVYCTIFVTGVVGNVCTCIVIARNNCMHTATNYYLFSLAVSDLMTIVIGLPPDLVLIWKPFPWIFGEPFCIFKNFVSEMTSYASILTITAFTVERYVAICHPIKSQTMSNLSRAVVIIVIIWVIACVCALPFPIFTRTFYDIFDHEGKPLEESLVCSISFEFLEALRYMVQISAFVFFVAPMTTIIIMYILIGITLRKSAALARASSAERRSNGHAHNTSGLGHGSSDAVSGVRKTALRVLVAVVIGFFVCFAPYHCQRLMTLYVTKWTSVLHKVHSHLYYISGVLYFVSSTVNPILYNVMSKKYREAFKNLCHGSNCVRKNPRMARGSLGSGSRFPMNSFRRTFSTSMYTESPRNNSRTTVFGHHNFSGSRGHQHAKQDSSSALLAPNMGTRDTFLSREALRDQRKSGDSLNTNLHKCPKETFLTQNSTCLDDQTIKPLLARATNKSLADGKIDHV
ncbi:pyrokinin-1 receptor [Lingula anatina]|uniref:Pyrokinin-1 receptor n=1 Tax=Lingula anatina TaxID=7574 RepID=A0A1S3HM77_LINAN|nr:pyrokinin-1 receptor [Lingula anatina]XP_013387204.1 pyrokinin-1 receptor [Lingula anatina]XP_013387205.1 pyrokinin-1 receptor [Lingula anatina]XP_013387206.1 pyrokinin-1 receptor [Lingula anatina]|eukprot:XP_013387203.1 pyrokinin-1 receptor [Lingula anatina]